MGNQKFSHECEPFKLWLSSSLTLISFRFSSNFSPSLLPLVNTPFTPYQSALVSSLFLLSPFIFRMFGCFFLFSKSFAWLRRGLFCLGSTISLNTEVPFQLYSLYLLFSHPFLTCFFPLSFPLSSLCALLFLTFHSFSFSFPLLAVYCIGFNVHVIVVIFSCLLWMATLFLRKLVGLTVAVQK